MTERELDLAAGAFAVILVLYAALFGWVLYLIYWSA